MDSNKYEIKKGDQFYCIHRGYIRGLVTIERLTKTQAISKNCKFKRIQFKNTPIDAIGSVSYNTVFYYKRTIDLDNKYKKQKLLQKLNNFDWSKYDLQNLIDIDNLIKGLE